MAVYRLRVPAFLLASLMIAIVLFQGKQHSDNPSSLRLLSSSWMQPKITVIEKRPAQRVFGSLSLPGGSPWCDKRPTYWLAGHQTSGETPFCQETDGSWKQPGTVFLDKIDDKNAQDGSKHIDRHECTALDVNDDGLDDILCLVGANKGKALGYNELYLTKADGSISKVKTHGLQKYPSMRTRHLAKITNHKTGDVHIFVTTNGKKRTDGKPNQHAFFRLLKSRETPYFEEVEQKEEPWKSYFYASCAVSADINKDRREDLIVCNADGPPLILSQRASSEWNQIGLDNNSEYLLGWRNVRVADMNNDGRPDLIVAYEGSPTHVRIFLGIRKKPYFDFRTPYYEVSSKNAVPDIEVLDINKDGWKDLYIVKLDENSKYCSLQPMEVSKKYPLNNPNWVPPQDKARDSLLISNGRKNGGKKKIYRQVNMRHKYPGCGYFAKRYASDQSMILAEADTGHPGYNLLLEW